MKFINYPNISGFTCMTFELNRVSKMKSNLIERVSHLKGLFTVNVNVSICDVASKWVQLISVELFTFNDAKCQRKKNAHCE